MFLVNIWRQLAEFSLASLWGYTKEEEENEFSPRGWFLIIQTLFMLEKKLANKIFCGGVVKDRY